MDYTQENLIHDGYLVPAAAVDSWREYDEQRPVPNYFDFDWLSSRHPDLYHRFALSTDGLMRELEQIVDLSGLDVIDVCAGTGRSAMALARRARSVAAVDIFAAVVRFGAAQARQAGLRNLAYNRGDCHRLPFADNTFDALTNSWAILDLSEAYRVLKPGGYLVRMGAPLLALCGELTDVLAPIYPHLIQQVGPDAWFEPASPAETTMLDEDVWEGLPVFSPSMRHDFTYIADYGKPQEAAAIFGRLYGPVARDYLLERRQAHVAWRLRIEVCRVRK